ncbi:alpha/beta fold hydrolase [Photobacterium sp. TY1-4]|uniref:alpha/beta fold hydrolase n=1 Tax=Photobacterium sp. TY1-4 TaxID=2899122 RepID=UPI0021C20825|nr:alpha/beta hydrolase [Photobacterium sp. TY1-4]UXI03920.1 alpha/beta hydrolase [Photobacterium sp. TY1-4]
MDHSPPSTPTTRRSVSSRPLVLLRGLLREQRHWGAFYPLLCQHYPQRQVICLDLAGNGARYQAQSPGSIRAMVNDLRGQLHLHDTMIDEMDETDEIDLIAISMGGMIALDWMTGYPNEIHSAVLINTSVRPYSPFYRRLNWRQLPRIGRTLFSPPAVQEATIMQLTSNFPEQHQAELEQWIRWRQEFPVNRSNALIQLSAAARFNARVSPTKPTLLVASRQDQLVDVSCSQMLATRWQVPLVLHPCAGHDLPLDDPHWLLEQIRHFDRTCQAQADTPVATGQS